MGKTASSELAAAWEMGPALNVMQSLLALLVSTNARFET
jgi:hypothetical protein